MAEIEDGRVKYVVNYLLQGWRPTGPESRRAWTVGLEALRATAIEGQSKQQWEKAAIRYVRKNMFRQNPQNNQHRIEMVRELLVR